MIGTVIDGRYEISRHLGGGGMAQVYLATDKQTEQPIANKLMNTEHLRKSRSLERFRREGRLLCRMHHPNLVRGMGMGQHDGRPYISMEYIDGPSVGELIARRGKLTPEESMKLLLEISLALNHLYMQGAVQAHRDIKPTNILVDAGGIAKLTDFGIAKSLTEDESVTMTSSFLGSPHYMSPEQITDPRTADIRSDIYALGAVFYEMLTGEKAYPGSGTKDILDAHFELEAPQIEGNAPLASECNHILALTLARGVPDRYQTPRELVEALAPLVGDVQVSVPRIARGTVRLAVALGALAIASVLMIGLVFASAGNNGADSPSVTEDAHGSGGPVPTSGPTTQTAEPVEAPTAGPVEPDQSIGDSLDGGSSGWTNPDAQEEQITGQ